MILPDGTTLMVDAGDLPETNPRTLSPRNSDLKPNRSRSAPEWIVDYVLQFAPQGRPPVLDYALITHYHADHFGAWDENRPRSADGGYIMTGIMAVGDQLPIRKLLDRGDDYPVPLRDSSLLLSYGRRGSNFLRIMREYWKFADYHRQSHGLERQQFQPGSRSQITLRYEPSLTKDFEVRNIASNGMIWTGYADDESYNLFEAGQYPGENPLSNCIRIRYGRFDYFTGGDIFGVNGLGEGDPDSVEAHVAPVIGPVDVATLNHHGNRNSQSAYYVRTVRPRVWIGQSWSSDHPGDDVLRRMTSTDLYPGDRDLFATDMLEANQLVIGPRIANSYRSLHGHVVVRVDQGGATYRVFVLDDSSEKREVLQVFGPYESR
jgi:hypothetical protein